MESLTSTENNFSTLIIGAGPETLALLIDLLKQSKDGCVILDKSNSFGSGRMEDYIARSTKSSALSFIKLLLKSPESEEEDQRLWSEMQNAKIDESLAQVVSTFRNISSVPKVYELCLPMFRELLDTTVFSKILEDNLKSSHLSSTGYFLKLLGNSFLYHMKVVKNVQLFHAKKEVICLRLLADGSILVTTKIGLEEGDGKKSSSQDKTPTDKFLDYKTRRVLLTTPGGLLQPTPRQQLPAEKVVEVENFLQESGYYKVHSNLSKQAKKKILIIGGNPAAFACVQLLLKGHEYTDFHEETLSRSGAFMMKRQKFFEREQLTVSHDLPKVSISTNATNSTTSNKSPTKGNPGSSSLKSSGGIAKSSPNKHQLEQPPKKEVFDENRFLNYAAYGSIRGKEFKLLAKCSVKPLIFEEGDIVIAHRNDIKVSFPNAAEANKMGYRYENSDTNKKGEINASDGLEGESKRLYFDILGKVEKRVKLVKIDQPGDLNALVDDACYIIDCQGYEHHLIPIKDVNGVPLKIKRGPNGGYLIDDQGRLVSEKGVIKGIYAIGYGFEEQRGDKTRVIEPFTKFTKYNNFGYIQNMLRKDHTLKNLIQDVKNFDPNEENYEELSGVENKVTNFSHPPKIEEKKDSFDLEGLSNMSAGNDQPMYSTLRMFEKLNADKNSKNQNTKSRKNK